MIIAQAASDASADAQAYSGLRERSAPSTAKGFGRAASAASKSAIGGRQLHRLGADVVARHERHRQQQLVLDQACRSKSRLDDQHVLLGILVLGARRLPRRRRSGTSGRLSARRRPAAGSAGRPAAPCVGACRCSQGTGAAVADRRGARRRACQRTRRHRRDGPATSARKRAIASGSGLVARKVGAASAKRGHVEAARGKLLWSSAPV